MMTSPRMDEFEETARNAMHLARAAQTEWGRFTPEERGRLLRRFRDRLLDRMEEVITTTCAETGKPRFDVVGEIFHCCDLIGQLCRKGPKWLKPRRVWPHLFPHKTSEIQYPPVGVVGVISPWNYPIVLTLSPVVQALIAGNGVVLKPSERTPGTADLLVAIFREATKNHPVLQQLQGGPAAAIALAEAGVDKLIFIGGSKGGRAIASIAARKLIPTVMELGGNDAMLVAADADLKRAARGAAWGSFFNAGQSCLAVERCLVEKSVFESFLKMVVSETASLRVAETFDGPKGIDHDVGPMISLEEWSRVAELVKDAVGQGAKVEIGGIPEAPKGRIFPPTVLSQVTPAMKIFQQEIFGPILLLTAVDRIEDALSLANESSLGLSASLWSKDVRRARRLATQLHVGGVCINDCLTHFGIVELPFGGVRESGFGRLQGKEGLRTFCSTRTVTWQRFAMSRAFHWFPNGDKHRWLARLTRGLFRSGWRKRFHAPPPSST